MREVLTDRAYSDVRFAVRLSNSPVTYGFLRIIPVHIM